MRLQYVESPSGLKITILNYLEIIERLTQDYCETTVRLLQNNNYKRFFNYDFEMTKTWLWDYITLRWLRWLWDDYEMIVRWMQNDYKITVRRLCMMAYLLKMNHCTYDWNRANCEFVSECNYNMYSPPSGLKNNRMSIVLYRFDNFQEETKCGLYTRPNSSDIEHLESLNYFILKVSPIHVNIVFKRAIKYSTTS